jgi:hypothetical protein
MDASLALASLADSTDWAINSFRFSTPFRITGKPNLARMKKAIPKDKIIQNSNPVSGINNDI